VGAAPERSSVLVELEALQNDLLQRLDELDRQVRGVLKEWTSTRQSELTVISPEPTQGE